MAAAEAYDLAWLRSTKPPRPIEIHQGWIVDLFFRLWWLSLGLFEACRALGMKATVLANDIDPDILAVAQTTSFLAYRNALRLRPFSMVVSAMNQQKQNLKR